MPMDVRLRDLLEVAQRLGYPSAAAAKQVLVNNGVSKLDPEKTQEYQAILVAHADLTDSMRRSILEGAPVEEKRRTPKELGEYAAEVMKRVGQDPWLFKPVAYSNERGYRMLESLDQIRKDESLVYEGVTKDDHLNAIEEAEKSGTEIRRPRSRVR